jgi:light-regulated signal transduction histidine kinase (bacteriophytochrome)
VDCNVVLQEVAADLDTAIREADASITASPLPVITGLPTGIKQVFQNLIANGIKFRKKDMTPVIRISAKAENGAWKFSFADNGIGIEKQYSDRIFVIFQRLHTRTEYEGSGIGLSQCKKIIELHKGRIWIESIRGEGTTVCFTIPKNII